MAHFVPVLSSVVGKMTSGERRFARRLESHLEDDYICWYDVPVGSLYQHPDFLVFHPRRGLLVLEVKDWKLESIQSIDRIRVTLQVDGRAVRTASPMEQARQYAHRIKQLLESDPALVGEPGSSYEGKLIFPWGYGVVLANISRKAFAGTDLGNVIPPERVICQDEMVESVDAEAFQQRLWDMFTVTFKCLLTLPQVDRVRWHLFPEIRVSQGTFDLGSPSAPKVETVPDIVRVMDLQQEQLARSMGEGHRVIHGVAGSGKTMILGYRAQHLAQALANKPILILCFNRALAARLQQMVEERGLAATVSARSFHGWCNDQLRLYHLRRPEGKGDEFIEKLVQTVIQGVDSGQVPRAQYGAVLVDEGHDFEPEWLKLVAQMVHPETNSLLVLYDDAQSINRRKARLGFSFAEVGIQARGRTTILRMNYRNTAQIMAVACEFARDLLSAKEAEEDAIPLVAPQSAGRSGSLPELRSFAGEEAELAYVVERAQALHKGGTAWKDMAILFRYNKQGERFAQALGRAGIPYDLLAATGSLANDSVKILSMHSSKGLEFPVVFLPCLDSMPAPSQEVAAEAKLLYVAMTRAMERLHMTHHGRSVFVDRVRAAVGAGTATRPRVA